MGYRPPILHIPLGPYQDEKIIKYLKGVDLFLNFLGAPKGEKNSKSTQNSEKCHFARCRIVKIYDTSWYKHYN